MFIHYNVKPVCAAITREMPFQRRAVKPAIYDARYVYAQTLSPPSSQDSSDQVLNAASGVMSIDSPKMPCLGAVPPIEK